jgi:hypothetical protein
MTADTLMNAIAYTGITAAIGIPLGLYAHTWWQRNMAWRYNVTPNTESRWPPINPATGKPANIKATFPDDARHAGSAAPQIQAQAAPARFPAIITTPRRSWIHTTTAVACGTAIGGAIAIMAGMWLFMRFLWLT